MQKVVVFIWLSLISGYCLGQESLNRRRGPQGRWAIHYYPSALVSGDISFGVEQSFRKRVSQEVSFNLKSFKSQLYYFDRGVAADYLVKYYLFEGNKFTFSANLSAVYKNFYFRNKAIEYAYSGDTKEQPKIVYEVILEDRRHSEYGIGTGINFNFKLYKDFFIGTDIGLNFVKYKVSYHYKEILYLHPDRFSDEDLILPSKHTVQQNGVSPLLRLKVGYCLKR